MPVARVRMPDGRVARVRVPDGADPEQVKAMALSWHNDQVSGKAPLDEPSKPALDVEAQRARQRRDFERLKTRELENMVDSQGFGQNFAIGYGGVAPRLAEGAKQLYARATDNQPELDKLQNDAAAERESMSPINETGGGVLGNLAANVALTAVPGSMVSKAGTAAGLAATTAPKLATLAALMGGEGAIGAATGALTPTVPGESAMDNTKYSAALNALMPLGGAALRSTPVQYAADKILDYTPLLYGARRNARNAAGKLARDAERATVKQENDALWNAYDIANKSEKITSKAEEAGFNAADSAAKAEAKKVAAAKTIAARQAEALRANVANTARDATLNKSKQDIAALAGWDVVPTNKIEFDAQHSKIGKAYGDIIDPLDINIEKALPEIQKHAADAGLIPTDASVLSKTIARLRAAAGEDAAPQPVVNTPASGYDIAPTQVDMVPQPTAPTIGKTIPGERYKTIRAEITQALGDTSGAEREALIGIKDSLDRAVEGSATPEELAKIADLRAKYSLGTKLKNLDWVPGEGMDPLKARRVLDKYSSGTRPTAAQQQLIEMEKSLPDVVKPNPAPRIEPEPIAPVPRDYSPTYAEMPRQGLRDMPAPFQPEGSDYAKMGAILAALHYTAGPSGLVGLPMGALLAKGANNPEISKVMATILRGANANYGSGLGPLLGDGAQ